MGQLVSIGFKIINQVQKMKSDYKCTVILPLSVISLSTVSGTSSSQPWNVRAYLTAIWEQAPDSGIKGKLCLYFQFIKKYYSNIFW